MYPTCKPFPAFKSQIVIVDEEAHDESWERNSQNQDCWQDADTTGRSHSNDMP